MATETETSFRSYYVVKPSDLLGSATAEIMFGLMPAREQEGPLAEMAFRWYELGGRTYCRLEIYGDSWAAFSRMPDVFAALGTLVAEHDSSRPWHQPEQPTVEKIVETLQGLGFVDYYTREMRA